MSNIDKELVQKLYKLLDKKNPAKLARMLEIMVAMLRGK